MSKLEDKLNLYTSEAEKLGIKVDADLFKLVTKGLGPSIYKEDAELVSSSQKAELETIKKNFLIPNLLELRMMGSYSKFTSRFLKIILFLN